MHSTSAHWVASWVLYGGLTCAVQVHIGLPAGFCMVDKHAQYRGGWGSGVVLRLEMEASDGHINIQLDCIMVHGTTMLASTVRAKKKLPSGG